MKLSLFEVAKVATASSKVGALLIQVAMDVVSKLPDGITAVEARELAVKAFDEVDLKVMVNGIDVISPETQGHLLAAVGGFARDIVHAATAKRRAKAGEAADAS